LYRLDSCKDFPVSTNAYQKEFPERVEFPFVSSINTNTGELLYSTLFGGKNSEGGRPMGMVLDKNGFPTMAGVTLDPTNFQLTPNAYMNLKQSKTPPHGTFIVKVNADGSNLLSSAMIGGDVHELVEDIDMDKDGNFYICGNALSFDFPFTTDALQIQNHGAEDLFCVSSIHL